jgi:hypothetical protein
MKKTLLITLIFFCLTKLALAQDFSYDQVSPGEIDMKSYARDTSAHAVVLQEYGSSRIDLASDDHIRLIYEYHVKIKIFDNKGFDNGTVEIPVYNNSNADSYETVENITGVTYYKDDNGLTQKIELENTKIYPVKENKHYAVYKFAMPGLRNGCVIEYKYRLISPYFENFHSWQLQGYIPKVYSEYQVHIPGLWTYNASLRGSLKLTVNKAEIEKGCFIARGITSDCSFITYGMSDIPAFKIEDYMTSPKNFLSAIYFELAYETDQYGAKTKYTKEWKDVDYALKTYSGFGSQLKRKGLFKDRIVPVIAEKGDDLAKARAIYNYIQKSFKWNDYYGIYSDGIGKPFEDHIGSVADINFSLVTALNAANLNAETVLLSVRDNGTVNQLYPVLGDFDYVVAKVNIGDKSYLLDATDPLLPFGMLPFRCLNDKGRVFSLDKPSYWIDLNLPQKEKSTYALDLTLTDDGKLKGTITNYSIGYEAYERRAAIKKFNTIDEYVEDLNAKLPKLKILKSDISNLDSLDQPICEKYEVEITVHDKLNGDNLTFNPFFMNMIKANPFKLVDRAYPVDMGMPSDERFILTLHLPAQYTIQTAPQVISMALPNDGGKFLTAYNADSNSFTFSNVIQFNRSVYSTDEYPYLKEFYNKIIQSEKAEMVFKKK